MFADAEVNTDLQRLRSSAMFLASQEDCALLARAFKPEKMADDCSWLEYDEMTDYSGCDDNGGDPDGNSWLLWPCDDTLIAHAKKAGVSYEVVAGFELPYPRELSEAYHGEAWDLDGRWSGISCEECAFVVSESDAVEFMRAVSGIQS